MVGNIGSYLVPAGAMVKIAKGANALAKTNRTIRGGLANVNRALGRKGRKATKVTKAAKATKATKATNVTKARRRS